MKYISEVTGKTYKDVDAVWIKNWRQAGRFIKHGAIPIDVVVAKHTDDVAIVFDKEETAELMRLWNSFELN